MSLAERVIVALDVDHAEHAGRLVAQLGDAALAYKIGLQLLTADGPALARELAAAGKQVFLDLKLLEIPNSVAGAVTAAGCHGVVASAREAALLKQQLPPGTLIVTPGTQPAGMARNDQARTATPAEALRAGATHVVIGRAITQAADPRAAFDAICHSLHDEVPACR